MSRVNWLVGLSALLLPLGCGSDPASSPATQSPGAPPVAGNQATMIPTPEQALAAGNPAFTGTLSAKARAQIASDLAAFRYKPSSRLELPARRGAPIGTSFQADDLALRAKLKAERGDDVIVNCQIAPCTLYGDFDGDGKRDMVAQVSTKDGKAAGAFFLMTAGTTRLLGLEIAEVSDAFRSLSSWQVLPAGIDGRKGAALGFSSLKAGVAREARFDATGKFALTPLR